MRSDRSPGTEDSSLLAERHPAVVGAGLGRERYLLSGWDQRRYRRDQRTLCCGFHSTICPRIELLYLSLDPDIS